MLDQVLKTIKDNNLIQSSDKIVLGLSAGPDSVCLLTLLAKLKQELNFDLVLAHVNYNLRGKDSFLDMILARKLAELYNLPIYVKEVKDLGLEVKGLEEKCRQIRYDYFNEILIKEKCNKIAVAHNRDDDAETILMFFLRGSGLKGLSGIKYQQNNIIRPLLDCYKRDILLYLKENHLEYRVDKTNFQKLYLRNRIRHELIPFLEKDYNQNLRSTICQSAKTLKDDSDYIEKVAKIKLKELSLDENYLKLEEFLALDKSLQRAILRLKLAKYKDISFLDLEEALRILRTAKNGSMRQIKGLQIRKDYDRIMLVAS
ncbi:MAG: tRNA lysidine(34) synthetase TilS [Patescibacteria group bacterium]|nr:tRNA lysidine(34) synthetase TilS [Patescibacteria group bacterium]